MDDPILEALTFALENQLNLVSEVSESSCSLSSGFSSKGKSSSHLSGDGPAKASEDLGETSLPPTTWAIPVVGDTHFAKSSVLLGEDQKIVCPFRECLFSADENVGCDKSSQEVLAHLLTEHKLVIENPDEIANLSKYLNYWKEKLDKGSQLKDFCVGFAMEPLPAPVERKKGKKSVEEPAETTTESKGCVEEDKAKAGKPTEDLYYMLSPALPEDSQLRKLLWKKRLETVLEVNRQEREETTFCRRCLFCREVVTGNRSDYFYHMRNSHSFHIGQPDNLVFVKELFQFIEDKLNRLECLCCEHIFKDKVVLKEHMRKKQHRKINPQNREYDRFYVVNYLEPGKTWETLENEDQEDERREDEWVEPAEEKERNIVCLFCTQAFCDFEKTLDHMKTIHVFDFEGIASSLDFYQKVKLVNFIRRTVYQNTCLVCKNRFPERVTLLQHIVEHNINGSSELMPSSEQWNRPEYFFPTYESDDFLTCLDDEDKMLDVGDGVSSEDESNVIPEDFPHIEINREFDLAGFAIKYHNQKN